MEEGKEEGRTEMDRVWACSMASMGSRSLDWAVEPKKRPKLLRLASLSSSDSATFMRKRFPQWPCRAAASEGRRDAGGGEDAVEGGVDSALAVEG